MKYLQINKDQYTKEHGEGRKDDMMKNDLLLKIDILESLKCETDIDANTIGIEVHHGFVCLAGSVASDVAMKHARDAAQRVEGVRGVTLDLDVTQRR